jgi:hypothetical protein
MLSIAESQGTLFDIHVANNLLKMEKAIICSNSSAGNWGAQSECPGWRA